MSHKLFYQPELLLCNVSTANSTSPKLKYLLNTPTELAPLNWIQFWLAAKACASWQYHEKLIILTKCL